MQYGACTVVVNEILRRASCASHGDGHDGKDELHVSYEDDVQLEELHWVVLGLSQSHPT